MDDISLEEIIVRRATPDDYDGVMAISKGVYDGLDYLPQQYHELYQNKNSNFFVGEYKGQIVSTQQYIMNYMKTKTPNCFVREYKGHILSTRLFVTL